MKFIRTVVIALALLGGIGAYAADAASIPRPIEQNTIAQAGGGFWQVTQTYYTGGCQVTYRTRVYNGLSFVGELWWTDNSRCHT